MTDETQHIPPDFGATQQEISRFIQARNAEMKKTNSFNYYSLDEYLADAKQPDTKDALKSSNINHHFSSQIHQMQTTIDYLLLKCGQNELKNAMTVQRRFCETIRLLHKIKTDNRKLKQKTKPEK